MKLAWTILKVLLLTALVIGAFFGYRFFNIWQDNKRPEVLEAKWENPETTLGGTATLLVTLKAPWHRDITSAQPVTHPDDFPPIGGKSAFQKNDFTLNGTRVWKLRVPFVATSTTLSEGQSVSFPIKKTERISPMTVNVPLPELTIISPAEVPREIANPITFLQPEAPAPLNTVVTIAKDKSHLVWLVALAVFLIILILFLTLKKAAQIAAIPPWELAMGKLDAIDVSQNSTTVVASLTDILKDYTSERFGLAANTKTSSEFLKIVGTIPDLSEAETEPLPWLANVADAAKFAGRSPADDAPARALTVVRGFVQTTTPQEAPVEH